MLSPLPFTSGFPTPSPLPGKHYKSLPATLPRPDSDERSFLFSPVGFQSPGLALSSDFSSPSFDDLHSETQAAETLTVLARDTPPIVSENAKQVQGRKRRKTLQPQTAQPIVFSIDARPPAVKTAPDATPEFVNPPGLALSIEPPLQDVYYRNDRKSLQCFPVCPTHGSYERAVHAMAQANKAKDSILEAPANKASSKHHNETGSCKGSVRVTLTQPPALPPKTAFAMYLRFVRLPETPESRLPGLAQPESLDEDKLHLIKGELDASDSSKPTWVFTPRSWKLVGELNRAHRSNIDKKAFTMQVVLFERHGEAPDYKYRIVAMHASSHFEVLNCKTLMRDLVKADKGGEEPAVRPAAAAAVPLLPPPPPPQQLRPPGKVAVPTKAAVVAKPTKKRPAPDAPLAPVQRVEGVRMYVPPAPPPMTPMSVLVRGDFSLSVFGSTPSTQSMLQSTPFFKLSLSAFDEPDSVRKLP